MKQISIALMLCSPLIACTAHANPVSYYFEDTSLQGGGTINGSFTYDADTNKSTNINFTTGFGAYYPGAKYTTVFTNDNVSIPLTSSNFAFDTGNTNAGSPFLILWTPEPLTNAGGTTTFMVREFDCVEDDCAGIPQQDRIGGGTITSDPSMVAPVPEPASLTLIFLGTAVVAALSRLKYKHRNLTQGKRSSLFLHTAL